MRPVGPENADLFREETQFIERPAHMRIIGVTFDSSDLDYLLAKMDKLPASLIQPPED